MAALIDGVPAFITGDVVELLPNQSVGFGYESDRWINSYEFDASPSTYVPVALQFERSGIVEANVLVVPPDRLLRGNRAGSTGDVATKRPHASYL